MKKLGKKLHGEQETIEAYLPCGGFCVSCDCGYVDQARYNVYYSYSHQLYADAKAFWE